MGRERHHIGSLLRHLREWVKTENLSSRKQFPYQFLLSFFPFFISFYFSFEEQDSFQLRNQCQKVNRDSKINFWVDDEAEAKPWNYNRKIRRWMHQHEQKLKEACLIASKANCYCYSLLRKYRYSCPRDSLPLCESNGAEKSGQLNRFVVIEMRRTDG